MKGKRKIPRGLLAAAVIIGALFGLLLVAYIAAQIVAHTVLKDGNPADEIISTDDFKFDRVEEDVDIFEDEEYLQLERTVYYSDGAQTYPILSDNFPVPEAARLFYDYIDAIIHGDADKLNTFYTDEYLEEVGAHADFTMQRVYDALVTYLGPTIDKRTGQRCERVKLTYRISKNDGTFRRDIESDASREQIFTVIEQDGVYRISDMNFVYAVR